MSHAVSTGTPGRVIHIRDGQDYDVYVGRPGPWGNPWHVGRDGTRQEVLVRHREWLDMQLDEHFKRSDLAWPRKLDGPTGQDAGNATATRRRATAGPCWNSLTAPIGCCASATGERGDHDAGVQR